MKFIVLILLFVTFASLDAGIINTIKDAIMGAPNGLCPVIKPQPDFNMDKFMGTWYLYASSKFIPFEPKWKCGKLDFVKTGNKTFTLQDNDYVLTTGTKLEAKADAKVLDADPASFTLTLKSAKLIDYITKIGAGMDLPPKEQTGTVLSTDYDNFAVMYLCGNDNNGGHSGGAVLFNRKRPIDIAKSEANYNKALEIIHANGINDAEPFEKVVQDNTCDTKFSF